MSFLYSHATLQCPFHTIRKDLFTPMAYQTHGASNHIYIDHSALSGWYSQYYTSQLPLPKTFFPGTHFSWADLGGQLYFLFKFHPDVVLNPLPGRATWTVVKSVSIATNFPNNIRPHSLSHQKKLVFGCAFSKKCTASLSSSSFSNLYPLKVFFKGPNTW